MDLSVTSADLIDLVKLVVRGVADNRDLSLTAVATLGSLQRCGPQRITTLAATEGVSQPSMTQLVQRLEQRGLVERRSDPADGRVALVCLTGEGSDALAARRRRAADRVAELLADLPECDVQALADALAAVLPAVRERVGAAGSGDRGQASGPGAVRGRADLRRAPVMITCGLPGLWSPNPGLVGWKTSHVLSPGQPEPGRGLAGPAFSRLGGAERVGRS